VLLLLMLFIIMVRSAWEQATGTCFAYCCCRQLQQGLCCMQQCGAAAMLLDIVVEALL
jgi:hypothetical protein